MTKSEKTKKRVAILYDWLDNILFALIFVITLLTFVFKTYTVNGSSMEPTYYTGDFVVAYDLFYTPKQGDAVVVDGNNNLGKPIIKRVVATEGQTVIITEAGEITVDGVVFEHDGYNLDNRRGNITYPCVVPDGHVFLMGDNRAVSYDSRYDTIGCVDVRSIVGRAIYTL